MVVPSPERQAPTGGVVASDFPAAQRANRRNTIWLVVLLLVIGAALGYGLGWAAELLTVGGGDIAAVAWPSRFGLVGGAALLGIGVIASIVTFAAGGPVVLALTQAREVAAEQEPLLHNVVQEMAIAAGLPKPRVAVIETDALNAFATGMNPHRAAIGVTRGLLDNLRREELQGVIGHEMSHIANGDTRYMTAVGILVGLIALVSDSVVRGRHVRAGSSGGGHRRGGLRGSGLVLIVVLLFAILAPIAARLVQFAVSRQREYLADATAVQLTRNPLGLIGALELLGAATATPFRGANRATQHMFIVNPFRDFGDDASALVATHPPIARRIERLRNLGGR